MTTAKFPRVSTRIWRLRPVTSSRKITLTQRTVAVERVDLPAGTPRLRFRGPPARPAGVAIGLPGRWRSTPFEGPRLGQEIVPFFAHFGGRLDHALAELVYDAARPIPGVFHLLGSQIARRHRRGHPFDPPLS